MLRMVHVTPGYSLGPLWGPASKGGRTLYALHGLGGEVAIRTTSVSVPVFSMPWTHQGRR